MSLVELDVIREIPGYKVILKAILKSQIQQLVEQLASHTDEESVFLTASISDGTLSHLGSDSGKSFLEDHDDIKSQFLGFCLKKHHRKKQQEIEDERIKKAAQQRPSPQFPPLQRSPHYPSPRGLHPVALTRASPSNIRAMGMRHEPYPTRPRRPNFDQNRAPAPQIRIPALNQVIKIEPDEPDVAQAGSSTEQDEDADKATSSVPSSPSQTVSDNIIKTETNKDPDVNSESSVSTIPNEASDGKQGESSAAAGDGLSLDSDFLGLLPQTDDMSEGEQQQPSTPHTPTSAPQTPGSSSGLDPNVNVKLESLTEAEMDLEITGVEMGPSTSAVDPMCSQESWATDMQGTMGYTPGGATGSSADYPQLGQREYTIACTSGMQHAYSPAPARKIRSKYATYSPIDRANIGKYCQEHGPVATIRQFKTKFPNMSESSARCMRDKYRATLKSKKRKADFSEITEIPSYKRGKPLLLGEEIDQKVKSYVTAMMESRGAVINSTVVIATAKGIIEATDKSLLSENGGTLNISKDWAHSFMQRMNLTKRKDRTTSQIDNTENFEKLRDEFLGRIKSVVSEYEIPVELVITWDHVKLNVVPVSDWAMDEHGKKGVEISGHGDKRRITAVFAATMKGDFLPPQLIFEGKTVRCHPQYKFPDGWDITHSENHSANEWTQTCYIDHIIVPYLVDMRHSLSLPETTKALCIFDVSKVPLTDLYIDHLEKNNIEIVYVPACCTDMLQPLDISVGKMIKSSLKSSFEDWYSKQITQQLWAGEETVDGKPVQMPLHIMKELFSKWLVKMFEEVRMKSDLIIEGFRVAGITQVLEDIKPSKFG